MAFNREALTSAKTFSVFSGENEWDPFSLFPTIKIFGGELHRGIFLTTVEKTIDVWVHRFKGANKRTRTLCDRAHYNRECEICKLPDKYGNDCTPTYMRLALWWDFSLIGTSWVPEKGDKKGIPQPNIPYGVISIPRGEEGINWSALDAAAAQGYGWPNSPNPGLIWEVTHVADVGFQVPRILPDAVLGATPRGIDPNILAWLSKASDDAIFSQLFATCRNMEWQLFGLEKPVEFAEADQSGAVTAKPKAPRKRSGATAAQTAAGGQAPQQAAPAQMPTAPAQMQLPFQSQAPQQYAQPQQFAPQQQQPMPNQPYYPQPVPAPNPFQQGEQTLPSPAPLQTPYTNIQAQVPQIQGMPQPVGPTPAFFPNGAPPAEPNPQAQAYMQLAHQAEYAQQAQMQPQQQQPQQYAPPAPQPGYPAPIADAQTAAMTARSAAAFAALNAGAGQPTLPSHAQPAPGVPAPQPIPPVLNYPTATGQVVPGMVAGCASGPLPIDPTLLAQVQAQYPPLPQQFIQSEQERAHALATMVPVDEKIAQLKAQLAAVAAQAPQAYQPAQDPGPERRTLTAG